MAVKKKDNGAAGVIELPDIVQREIGVCLLGTSMLVMNRPSEKTQRQLLLPPRKKTTAERAMTLKHEPMQEYRDSVYRTRGEDGPTRLVFPGGAFKKAVASAALRIPGGVSKTEIGQLVSVVEFNVSMYGVPKLWSAIVRQADYNHTPDVRTRAVLPAWACEVTFRYPTPMVTERMILTLLTGAGIYIGVGDGRPEKGSSLSAGCFKIVPANDPEYLAVLAGGRLEQQDQALKGPEFYDAETEDLARWFDKEVERREQAPAEAEAGNGRMKNKRKKEVIHDE